MAGILAVILIANVMIIKVSSQGIPTTLAQFLPYTGKPQTGFVSNIPTRGISALPIQTLPTTGLTALSAAALPNLISTTSALTAPIQKPSHPALPTQPAEPPKPNVGPPSNPTITGVDASVLNNLAIALQLLIVSNMVKSPCPTSNEDAVSCFLNSLQSQSQGSTYPSAETPTVQPAYPPVQTSHPAVQSSYPAVPPGYSAVPPGYSAVAPQQAPILPNSNFLASSSLSDTGMPTLTARPQSSQFLMSPYDALLSTNSPFTDPILSSPFGSPISSKKDFKSPYTLSESPDFSNGSPYSMY